MLFIREYRQSIPGVGGKLRLLLQQMRKQWEALLQQRAQAYNYANATYIRIKPLRSLY